MGTEPKTIPAFFIYNLNSSSQPLAIHVEAVGDDLKFIFAIGPPRSAPRDEWQVVGTHTVDFPAGDNLRFVSGSRLTHPPAEVTSCVCTTSILHRGQTLILRTQLGTVNIYPKIAFTVSIVGNPIRQLTRLLIPLNTRNAAASVRQVIIPDPNV